MTGSLYLSLVTPEIVIGISLLALFQWIFRYLHVQLGMHTVVLAHVMFSHRLRRDRDLGSITDFRARARRGRSGSWWQPSGRHSGRSPCRQLAPGIVAAALLAFTVSFDDYVITSMVAGVDSETLPMVIYAMARRGANPVVNAISALITVGFGVLIVISEGCAKS